MNPKFISRAAGVGLCFLVGCAGDYSDEADNMDMLDDNEEAVTSGSSLWGANGELWQATGRLFDYSYAGYHSGDTTIPNAGVKANVRNFGATGDGKTDDTQAFLDAIAKTDSGVIFIPAGTYVITKRLKIEKSGIVLRGEGPTKTFLEFPKSLAQVDGKNPSQLGSPTPYSYGDAFLTITGNEPKKSDAMAEVTADAKRGTKKLKLSNTNGLAVGKWVTLFETDKDNSLAERLYGDSADPGTDLTGDVLVRFQSPISAMSGNQITLARPLPVDVEARWTPKVGLFKPEVSESGIERLSMHFKASPYLGHAKEAGYNAILLNRVFHSWVRDVRIVNADLGITQDSGAFCTITGVTVDTDFDRGANVGGVVGHHALFLRNARDSVVSSFNVQKTFIHDLSAEGGTMSVFSNGKGLDLNMDHHRDAPYGILFTNLDLGKGTRPFASGGADDDGAHSAAYTTYWGVRSSAQFKLPTSDFGPLLNIVGVNTSASSAPNGSWLLEKIAPASLAPANLHAAMLKKRTGN